MDKVFIVILNYKKWEDTAHCIDSVLDSDHPNFTIFVIDNFSGNDSLEKIIENGRQKRPDQYSKPNFFSKIHSSQINDAFDCANLPKILFIQNHENKGFASGNNVALKRIRHENAYVWLLNPDMVIEPGTIAALLDTAKKNDYKTIVGATVKYYEDKEKVHFYGGATINFNTATITFADSKSALSSLDYISGGCLFCHASHFETLGLLPEEFFLYWEETDWCYRAKLQGFQLVVSLQAICYDKISTTIGKGFLSDYYYTRNGLTFISRYRRKKLSFVIAAACLRIGKRILSGEWDRAKGVGKGILSFLTGRNENP
jgi:GT2 family glycosyltransferase